uniref:glutaminyl-peptide cyclotransferase n=1 Tax=Heligmosomoides polygyrus TaxID=6339 RepID=A0A8L8K078_HELPZ
LYLQRSHQLSLLPQNSTIRLCRDFMDPAGFRQILKPLLVERVVGTQKHRQVGEYIFNFFTNLGWSTEWDEFEENTPYGVKVFRNLIVTNPVRAPRRLVLACHYDSKILPGLVHPSNSSTFLRRIQDVGFQLIFFDGEEAFVEWSETDSLYGSRHLARKWESKWFPTTTGTNFELSREIDRIDVLMLLDLLGAPNPVISNTVGLGGFNTPSMLIVVSEAELRNLGCLATNRNIFQGRISYSAVEDDHIPFLKRGVPILHLITVPFPTVWHTARDNEKALDYPTIYHLTSVVRVFVAKYLGIAPL